MAIKQPDGTFLAAIPTSGPAGPIGTPGPIGPRGLLGPAGPRGPVGQPGPGTIGLATAAAPIPDRSIVVALADETCVPANPADTGHLGRVLGFVAVGVPAGTQAQYQSSGAASDLVVPFPAGDALFIAANGTLTNIAPTAGWIQQVGTATSATSIVVNLGEADLIVDGPTLAIDTGGVANKAPDDDAANPARTGQWVSGAGLAHALQGFEADSSGKADNLRIAPAPEAIPRALADTLSETLRATELGIETTLDTAQPNDCVPALNVLVASIPPGGTRIIEFTRPGFVNVGTQMSDLPAGRTLIIRAAPGVQWGGAAGIGGLRYSYLESHEQNGIIATMPLGQSAWFCRGVYPAHTEDSWFRRAQTRAAYELRSASGTQTAQNTESGAAYVAVVPDLSLSWQGIQGGNSGSSFCQKNALAGVAVTYDSAASQVVGTFGTCEIRTPNVLASGHQGRGIGWGMNATFRILPGAEGNAIGIEVNGENLASDPTEPDGTTFEKSLVKLVPYFTGFSMTAGVSILPTPGVRFRQGIYARADSFVDQASSRFLNFKTKFEVDRFGTTFWGGSTAGTAKASVDAGSGIVTVGQGGPGVGKMVLAPSTGSGSFNPIVNGGDSAIAFTTSLSLVPNSGAPAGLRVLANGDLIHAGSHLPYQSGYSLGASFAPWANLYLSSNPIIVSDERVKQDVRPLSDAELDAWGEVAPVVYRYRASVADKGAAAREHFGLIAQAVEQAFARHGCDPRRLGLFCADAEVRTVVKTRTVTRPKMETVTVSEDVIVVEDGRGVWRTVERQDTRPVMQTVPMVAQDGTPILRRERAPDGPRGAYREVQDTREVPVMESVAETYEAQEPTGETRLALRYEQCAVIEAAYQRRRGDRLEARLAALEPKPRRPRARRA